MKSFIAKFNKLKLLSGYEIIFVCTILYISFAVGVCAHESVGESFGATLWRCLWVTTTCFFGQRMLRRLPGGISIVAKYIYSEFKRTFSWE